MSSSRLAIASFMENFLAAAAADSATFPFFFHLRFSSNKTKKKQNINFDLQFHKFNDYVP